MQDGRLETGGFDGTSHAGGDRSSRRRGCGGLRGGGEGPPRAPEKARYCTNKDTVFVTASAWEGNGQIGSPRWKKSRTHDAVGICLGDASPTRIPLRQIGAFNEANGFSFKSQIPGVTGVPGAPSR